MGGCSTFCSPSPSPVCVPALSFKFGSLSDLDLPLQLQQYQNKVSKRSDPSQTLCSKSVDTKPFVFGRSLGISHDTGP